jgi:plasmid maintenance system antidote protein VapI
MLRRVNPGFLVIIMNGKRGIAADTALRLARYLE